MTITYEKPIRNFQLKLRNLKTNEYIGKINGAFMPKENIWIIGWIYVKNPKHTDNNDRTYKVDYTGRGYSWLLFAGFFALVIDSNKTSYFTKLDNVANVAGESLYIKIGFKFVNQSQYMYLKISTKKEYNDKYEFVLNKYVSRQDK